MTSSPFLCSASQRLFQVSSQSISKRSGELAGLPSYAFEVYAVSMIPCTKRSRHVQLSPLTPRDLELCHPSLRIWRLRCAFCEKIAHFTKKTSQALSARSQTSATTQLGLRSTSPTSYSMRRCTASGPCLCLWAQTHYRATGGGSLLGSSGTTISMASSTSSSASHQTSLKRLAERKT